MNWIKKYPKFSTTKYFDKSFDIYDKAALIMIYLSKALCYRSKYFTLSIELGKFLVLLWTKVQYIDLICIFLKLFLATNWHLIICYHFILESTVNNFSWNFSRNMEDIDQFLIFNQFLFNGNNWNIAIDKAKTTCNERIRNTWTNAPRGS